MNSLQMYCRVTRSVPHLAGLISMRVPTLRSANLYRVPTAGCSTPAMRTGSLHHGHQFGVGARLCSAAASSSNTAGQSSAVEQDKAQSVPVTVGEDRSSGDRGKRGVLDLWRNPARDLLWPFRTGNGLSLTAPPLPAINRLGSSLAHLSNSLNRVLRGLSPWRLFRRSKDDTDDDHHYRLKLDVPGLGKEDVKVTVEDGVLIVRGERRQDEYWSDDEEGEWWYGGSYGRYDASLVLPEDAKVDGIKAEVRNGVLYVTVPREGDKKKKHVTEVEVS